MCCPDSACVRGVCVRHVCAVCVCVACVCGVAANVINQTTASPAKPTANQNVQPAAKSNAVGCGRATRGEGAGCASSGIKVPQLRPEGRPSECGGRRQATAAKRPHSWAIGQPKKRYWAGRGRGEPNKRFACLVPVPEIQVATRLPPLSRHTILYTPYFVYAKMK